MTTQDEEFNKKLFATFKLEAKDRLQNISSLLLSLEKVENKEAAEFIESIYREFHSLKSAARAVSLPVIESLCQKLETLFSNFKEKRIKPTTLQCDLLHKASDYLDSYLNQLNGHNAKTGDSKDEASESLTIEIEQETKKILGDKSSNQSIVLDKKTNKPNKDDFDVDSGKNHESNEINKKETRKTNALKNEQEEHPAQDNDEVMQDKTVRIAVSKLDTLLLQAEEMLALKYDLNQSALEALQLKDNILLCKKDWDKTHPNLTSFKKKHNDKSHEGKKASKKILMKNNVEVDWKNNKNKLVETLDNHFKKILMDLDGLKNKLEQNLRTMTLGIDTLLEETKKLMLWPFSTILDGLPRMVRDLSRTLGKKVDLQLEGTEVEIDKRILEEIKDALNHIVRNAIDHGIETPEARVALKKKETGTLALKIQHMTGNEIQIEIQDDGAGINVSAVKDAAMKLNIISEKMAEKLSQEEALSLIYQSGVSTSETMSLLSGRGLGMSIIREKIEKVGGKISLQSREHQGTDIKITLPLTLATFKGLLVRISSQVFVIPLSNIERILRLKAENIKSIAGNPTLVYGDQVMSLVWLSDILGIPRNIANKDGNEELLILILGTLDSHVAYVVDEVLNEYEILIKHFSKPLVKLKYVSAAAILDAGKPVPVLNVVDLLEGQRASHREEISSENTEELSLGKKEILLVEDSITTRMFLKNILELEGFSVTTAVDGLEAWEKLNNNDFAVLVSDIEMPRMDGFALTEKVRQSQHLKEMPIVLVTSRESQKDRERGIDVGANAYVLKSSFDSKHLVEIIKRFSL